MAPDEGSKKALVHLLTREIAHTNMFMKALESLGKLTDPYFGNVKPDETVNVYYHTSSNGAESRGPWNEAPTFEYVADPLKEKAKRAQQQIPTIVEPSFVNPPRVSRQS